MFKNRIRLPFYLSKPQFPVEKNVFRKADGSTKLLSAVVRNTYTGKTDQLPEDWHRKLVIALTHDEVTIEDNRLLKDVVLDGDYAIEWQDFLNYPLAQSEFIVQVTPFDATNSNCQSCSEISQIDLVDDTTDVVWDEGTTNIYPFSILDNDTICCFPFIVEIVSFNTDYFDSVTVDNAGILTATVKDPVPIIDGLLIATYRVTCANGQYDEANVYGNITGTSTECVPVTGLVGTQDENDGTVYNFQWIEPVPAPSVGYDWDLYLASDLGAVIQSGNVPTGNTLDLTGLTEGTQYVFIIYSKCAEGVSTGVTNNFTTPVPESELCGRFLVSHLPPFFTTADYSYMDCFGVIQNVTVAGIDERELCMMISAGGTTPTFFATGSAYVTYTYMSLC